MDKNLEKLRLRSRNSPLGSHLHQHLEIFILSEMFRKTCQMTENSMAEKLIPTELNFFMSLERDTFLLYVIVYVELFMKRNFQKMPL